MPEQQDDQFVQRRLMFASLLSAAAFLAYFYYTSQVAPPAPPPEPQPTEASAQTPADEPTPAEATASPAEDAGEAETPPGEAEETDAPSSIQAAAEREITVETDVFEVVFSNRGGVVRHWRLKDYEDANRERLDLVHQGGAIQHGFPFSLRRATGESVEGLDQALYAVNEGPDRRTGATEVSFEYADQNRRVRKTFRFLADSYNVAVETELVENGAAQPHLIAWPGGFGDTAQQQDWLYSQTFYREPGEDGGIEYNDADDAEDETLIQQGPYPFFGLSDLFFTIVAQPPDGRQAQLQTSAVEIRPTPDQDPELFAAAAFGAVGAGRNEIEFFIGPKDVDLLQTIDPRLRNIVDFGFFSFIAEPLFLMLRWTYSNLVANWGWAIVVLTCFINLALFPLKWSSSKSMKRMQALQPLIKEINAKYESLPMRDPKRQKQTEETMELYKKYNVNPVGGCFPMLLQLPFFYGFYRVLTVSIEMRHAEWLWVDDLSQPESLAVRILPLTMMGTQFLMQAMTPTPSVDPAQARMMKFMPLMMGFIFYQFQAGLVLYWLTGNVVGIGQQALLNKFMSVDLDIPEPQGKKRPAKKKKR